MFQSKLYEIFRGTPGDKDTRLAIPYLKRAGKKNNSRL